MSSRKKFSGIFRSVASRRAREPGKLQTPSHQQSHHHHHHHPHRHRHGCWLFSTRTRKTTSDSSNQHHPHPHCHRHRHHHRHPSCHSSSWQTRNSKSAFPSPSLISLAEWQIRPACGQHHQYLQQNCHHQYLQQHCHHHHQDCHRNHRHHYIHHYNWFLCTILTILNIFTCSR